MIVALSQLNSTVGDLNGNADLINDVIRKVKRKADILVFPEMSLIGYPAKDLLFDSDFIRAANDTLIEISKNIFDMVVIIGTIRIENDNLYNTAAIIQSGKIIGFRDKTLLPTYDVFDEKRYFSSSDLVSPIKVTINNKNINIGIQICEDLWDSNYDIKVTDILDEKGADVIVNLSSSPFHVSRVKDRIDLVKKYVKKIGKPYIYCNSVGYQEELIFDGQSFIINADGKLMKYAQAFKEEILISDMFSKKECQFKVLNKYEEIYKALSLGVKDYLAKTYHSKVVIGLSGGIDSAVTAAIAANALGSENIIGLSLPSKYSSSHSIRDAELLASNLNINFKVVKIHEINKQFLMDLSLLSDQENESLAKENLQARIRGSVLMTIANKEKALLLNTGNKTEIALGYCTLYGDMCGALSVISDLNKNEVYALAHWINQKYNKLIIPKSSLNKPPSAELSYDQVDPFDYDIISPLVEDIIVNDSNIDRLIDKGYDYELCRDVINKINLFEYKRYQGAPGIRVSKKAFGIGRKYPIINRYKV